MALSHDILLDDQAFITASSDMKALKTRTEALRTRLDSMYKALTEALNTPAGKQLEATAGEVLLQPIDDLLLVIEQVSNDLAKIIETGYYKGVFIEFQELNTNIKY